MKPRKKDHKLKEYCCRLCPSRFSKLQGLRTHETLRGDHSKPASRDNGPALCKECGGRFKTQRSLNSHHVGFAGRSCATSRGSNRHSIKPLFENGHVVVTVSSGSFEHTFIVGEIGPNSEMNGHAEIESAFDFNDSTTTAVIDVREKPANPILHNTSEHHLELVHDIYQMENFAEGRVTNGSTRSQGQFLAALEAVSASGNIDIECDINSRPLQPIEQAPSQQPCLLDGNAPDAMQYGNIYGFPFTPFLHDWVQHNADFGHQTGDFRRSDWDHPQFPLLGEFDTFPFNPFIQGLGEISSFGEFDTFPFNPFIQGLGEISSLGDFEAFPFRNCQEPAPEHNGWPDVTHLEINPNTFPSNHFNAMQEDSAVSGLPSFSSEETPYIAERFPGDQLHTFINVISHDTAISPYCPGIEQQLSAGSITDWLTDDMVNCRGDRRTHSSREILMKSQTSISCY